MEEVNDVLIFVDFYEDSDSLEKKIPNDMELGQEIRKLIIEYRNKLGE
jgi:hypothetical protein